MHRSCRWRTPSAESSLAVATHRPQGRRFRDRCGHASSRAEPYPPEGEGAFRPAGGSCLANRQVHGPPRGRPARRRDRRRLKTCNSWEPGGVSLTFASMRAPHCGHTRERDDVITAPEPALVFAISREARSDGAHLLEHERRAAGDVGGCLRLPDCDRLTTWHGRGPARSTAAPPCGCTSRAGSSRCRCGRMAEAFAPPSALPFTDGQAQARVRMSTALTP